MFLLVLHPVLLFAGGEKESEEALADPREQWTLLYSGIPLGEESGPLRRIAGESNIALKRELELCTLHHYSSDEQRSYRDYLRLRRDFLRRKEDSKNRRNGERRELLQGLASAGESSRGSESTSEYQLPKQKEIRFIDTEMDHYDRGKLLRQGADALLLCDLEKRGEGYILSTELYLPFLDDEMFSTKHFFRSDKLDAAAISLVDSLRSRLLGRPWAAIVIASEDGAFSLEQDGKRLSRSEYSSLFPGQIDVRIGAPGYHDQEYSIHLLPSERRTIYPDLRLLSRESYLLASPSGGPASVYEGGAYRGETPLILSSSDRPSVVQLRKEGYMEEKLYLEPSRQAGAVEMRLEGFEAEALVQEKREDFYNSFACFLLSVPLSMISYGNSMVYAGASNTLLLNESGYDQERYDDLAAKNKLWYTAYLGGVCLNVGLGIHTVWNLIEYLKEHERVYRIGRN